MNQTLKPQHLGGSAGQFSCSEACVSAERIVTSLSAEVAAIKKRAKASIESVEKVSTHIRSVVSRK